MSAMTVAHSISTRAAYEAVGAAVMRAEASGLAIATCVVDASGVAIAQLRMADAPFHSSAIAADKAFTAASFRLPTEVLGERLSRSPRVYEGIARQPRVILFAGGLPIIDGDWVIGGIGVSGASEEQDRQIAEAGLGAIKLAPSAPPSPSPSLSLPARRPA